MKRLVVILFVLLVAGCVEQPVVSTTFEVVGGNLETVTVEGVDMPLTENEAYYVAKDACYLYKLMEYHGKHPGPECEHWLFVDIIGDPCNEKGAKVCVDEPVVYCVEGLVSASAEDWDC